MFFVMVAGLLFFPVRGLAFQTISAASETDYPPFCLIDQAGEPTGFSVELMNAALAAMGRTAVYRSTGPWPEVRGLLERGEVEVLPLVGRTPEREALFDFTFPYMSPSRRHCGA